MRRTRHKRRVGGNAITRWGQRLSNTASIAAANAGVYGEQLSNYFKHRQRETDRRNLIDMNRRLNVNYDPTQIQPHVDDLTAKTELFTRKIENKHFEIYQLLNTITLGELQTLGGRLDVLLGARDRYIAEGGSPQGIVGSQYIGKIRTLLARAVVNLPRIRSWVHRRIAGQPPGGQSPGGQTLSGDGQTLSGQPLSGQSPPPA